MGMTVGELKKQLRRFPMIGKSLLGACWNSIDSR